MSSDSTEQRDSFRFAGRCDPDSTETLTVEMQDDATVEDVGVRIYQGPRLDLQIFPFVEVDSTGAGVDRKALINFPDDPEAKDYIDGNDDDFGFDVSRAVERDEKIGVEVENTDTEHAYDYTVDVIVDYEGGSSRPFAGVVDTVSGWI